MNAGTIEQIGTPEELYFKPRTVFAADFVGDSNFLDVVVDGRAEQGKVSVLGPSGVRLIANCSVTAPAAGAARLMLRPESLKIARGDKVAENSLEGVVTQTVFLGSVSKVAVAIATGQTVWVKCLSHDSGESPSAGRKVRLTWAAEHGVLLPQALRA